MKKIGKIYFAIMLPLFFVFMWGVIQTFKPVRSVTIEDVTPITGQVINIQGGSGFDIVIKLKDDSHHYYINRGLQLGLNLEKLRNTLLNKTVTLYSIDRWTLFTRDGIMGHISKLTIGEQVIFNEIQNDVHEQTTK